MSRRILIFCIAIFGVLSCDVLMETINNFPQPATSPQLTETEVIEGLKKALQIGVDSSVAQLGIINGYYKGHPKFVKIPLPEEAERLRETIDKANLNAVIDLDKQFEDVVKSVNRAAEEAAKKSTPIFVNAISDLTISQGWEILKGKVPAGSGTQSSTYDSTAATKYMKSKTYKDLTDLYAPYINQALGKDLGLGFSAVDAWETLTTNYNNLLSKRTVKFAVNASGVDLPANINTDLGRFSTEKALDGLFYKVGEEEKKIRQDPYQWTSNIIRRVFSYFK